MSNYDDRLKDYVDVKTRIAEFYAKHPDGRLQTSGYEFIDIGPDNYVVVMAHAYRTPDDPLPGKGLSWMKVPGQTNFTRGSELENTETSAWGRAIGALGIGIEKSIASANEVRNKEVDVTVTTPVIKTTVTVGDTSVETMTTPHDGLIGTAIAQGNHDFNLRQTPDGWVLPFRVKNGSKSFIVRAENKLAEALSVIRPTVEGKRVTVWGHWTDETIPAKGTKPQINYRVLHLERIETPDGTLPPAEDIGPEPPDDVPLAFEAPTEEMGL